MQLLFPANNKHAYQTDLKHWLVCAFVIHIQEYMFSHNVSYFVLIIYSIDIAIVK